MTRPNDAGEGGEIPRALVQDIVSAVASRAALDSVPGADDNADTAVLLALGLVSSGRSVGEYASALKACGRRPSWQDVPAFLDAADRRSSRSGHLRHPGGSTGVDALAARVHGLLARARAEGMEVVGLTSSRYPPLLRHLPDPPPVLWVRGTVETLGRAAVAVVGARAASPAALETARRLGRDLAAAGLLVVSGLARGIDAAAHTGALEAGLTAAILGSGLDVVYPPEHRALAVTIGRTGVVASEFPPGTPPRPGHFPQRNRIVAGLSRAVVVVEAGERSGALITAREALDQGRDVMVVPGAALAGRNRGGHGLIKDGAFLVEDARDVLAIVAPGAARWEGIGGTGSARSASASLAAELGNWRLGEELDLDDLSRLLDIEPARLLGCLLRWELAGLVGRSPAGRFVRLSG